jgi:arylsulfatase A-like enzyme
LQALDDLVAGVVNKLSSSGVLRNTYVFFTSDNGWETGEHRLLDGKRQFYEESIHIPLLVRGPGVAAGSTTSKLVLNADFFPTLATLAGTQPPSYVDGRSLRPVLNRRPTNWRSAILLEARYQSSTRPSAYGIRTSNGRKYIEYAGGVRELYNLRTDPYELRNTHNAATPPISLVQRLEALKVCTGNSCRAAENGP